MSNHFKYHHSWAIVEIWCLVIKSSVYQISVSFLGKIYDVNALLIKTWWKKQNPRLTTYFSLTCLGGNVQKSSKTKKNITKLLQLVIYMIMVRIGCFILIDDLYVIQICIIWPSILCCGREKVIHLYIILYSIQYLMIPVLNASSISAGLLYYVFFVNVLFIKNISSWFCAWRFCYFRIFRL